MEASADLPSRDPVLAARTAELLADGTPRTVQAIAASLGLPPPRDEDDQEDLEVQLGLDDHRYAYRAAKDDYLDLFALLAGRIFTHMPGPSGVGGDTVTLSVDPDLDLLLMPTWRSTEIPLAGGGAARWDDDALTGQLTVPHASFALASASGTLGFTWRGDTLLIQPVDIDVDEGRRLVELLRAAFDAICEAEEQECAELADVVIDVLLGDSRAYRVPVAPLSELLGKAGLSRRGDYVGPSDTPWQTPLERAPAERDALNASVYGFESCCHDAFHDLSRVFLEFRARHAPDLEGVAEAADHGQVAEAFMAAEVTGPLAVNVADGLFAFTEALIAAGHEASPGVQFLRFAAHDIAGEPVEAEQALRRSLSADPDFSPALAEMATIAEERGAAATAIEHLRRLGVSVDDPQVHRLREMSTRSRSATGRNAPCPCGSGRKYKACCLARGLPPLTDRVMWLYLKAVAFANRPAERGLLLDLARFLAETRDSDDLLKALAEPLVVDVALFEEGLLDRYLQMRGALLPDDERALAEVCSGSQRSLFEITYMQPSGAVGLRDTRDGTVFEVPAFGTDDSPGKVGELLLGRLAPVGDAHRFFGPVLTISLRLRDSLVALTSGEADGDDWLEWLAAATAPPTLSNTEGEPLMLCEGRYTVADPNAAGRTLEQAFSKAEADGPERVFHQMLGSDQGRWIRGTVTLTDRDLRVQANSEARFTRLSDEVRALLPDARFVDEHRTSGKEMMSGLDPSPPSPSADPDRHEVVAEFLDDYYMRWLDMEIPALGGLTPRQAAVDPTRREDLRLLLDEFEALPGPGAPATQIRAALSLFSST